jgi:hypothetical protein
VKSIARNQTIKLGRKMEMLDVCRMHGNGLQCDDKGVLLKLGHCLTYNDTENTATLGMCPYFDIRCYNTTDVTVDNSSTFVRLPQNISELNDFMCGPLHREGFFCLNCIDDFGISLVSIGYTCSNCTNVWHGVLLYLTVELLPATLFYLLILLFDIHLTTAPITCFITLNQLFLYVAFKIKPAPFDVVMPKMEHGKLFQIYLGLSGVCNLDFIHYIVPPFCTSISLRQVDVAYFGYISAFYPFLLIFLTWILIELHDTEQATTDPRSLKVRIINFAVAVPILLLFNILPVVVLILYSFKCTRACGLVCQLSYSVSVTHISLYNCA